MSDLRSSDARNFDEIALSYDQSLPAHVVEHYLRKRVEFIARRCPPGRILDVGCGTGALAERLARQGYEVTGLDASSGMLEVLSRRRGEIASVLGSATAMPFFDGEFDAAITVATLHHIAGPGDVRLALGEMVRVVRADGLVIVWDHNPRNPYWPHVMRRVPQDTGTERLIGRDEIVDALKAAGATIVSAGELGLVPDFTPPWALGLARTAERVAERTPLAKRLCAHNVVVARAPGSRPAGS